MDWYAELKEDMNNHALRDYPREACGVILDDFTYKPCDNLSMEPALSFILDPAAFIKPAGPATNASPIKAAPSNTFLNPPSPPTTGIIFISSCPFG